MRDALFSIGTVGRLDEIEHAHTVIVPNRPYVETPSRPALLAALRRAHERGARLVGLCTGAFTLAEAGLLDGRRATVHWNLAEEFRLRFPAVDLEPDVLFVDDGDVLTSAGSAAALDLGLHIVRRDYGAEIANHVSRRLVSPPTATAASASSWSVRCRPPPTRLSPRWWPGPSNAWTSRSPSPTWPAGPGRAPATCTAASGPSSAPPRWPG
ncbi:AraC family transcriptional regulator [Actinoplanes sp. TRM88002]|uniref:AraC family transcriptional regulator n=1 Tax=Paractinoplanes hotanensis TaxID=2906497 RepID=A0ABT0XR33_9ACTN|nr:AraC family transcriptional regulator [Actinoplanes hotanensis]